MINFIFSPYVTEKVYFTRGIKNLSPTAAQYLYVVLVILIFVFIHSAISNYKDISNMKAKTFMIAL